MKKVFLPLLFTFFVGFDVIAQSDQLSSQKSSTSVGIGLGLPYGGIGLNVGTYVVDNLSVFGGIGYQFAGVGYNFGLLKDFPSNSQTQFYVTGMFGTNAGIVVEGASELDKLYTGATFGLGVKINSRKTEGNFWNIGLLVPIRSSEFKDDEEAIRNNPNIELNDALPIAIVVGYHINL
ncbi:hypothetical protein [Ekhidna sp.]